MPLTLLGRKLVVYGVLGVEFGMAGVCYYYWHNMNVSQGLDQRISVPYRRIISTI